MSEINVSLEQWQMLSAVVEYGGFQAAAEKLNKSQSTVSYGIQKLQEGLGVRIFEQRGRRAELTEAGQLILRRARGLLTQAQSLENAAVDLAAGWEPEIVLQVDVIFPMDLVVKALDLFAPESHGTRLDVVSSSLSGTQDSIINHHADLALCGIPPVGFLAERLFQVSFCAVTRPDHVLLQQQHPISEEELKQQRQIVLRDSGSRRRLNAGWLGAEQRWTVTSFQESISLLKQGLGFAFIPRHLVQEDLDSGQLQELPMEEGGTRQVDCNLIFPNKSEAGPACLLLAEKIKTVSKEFNCPWR